MIIRPSILTFHKPGQKLGTIPITHAVEFNNFFLIDSVLQ